MFADMIAYTINTEGQAPGRPQDGMDAYGFPWCAFGRAPDVESMENEFPLLIPFSSHWEDSGGAGKHRGGVGTAQLWVTHHAPFLIFMSIADNSTSRPRSRCSAGTASRHVPGHRDDGGSTSPRLLRAERRGTLTWRRCWRASTAARIVLAVRLAPSARWTMGTDRSSSASSTGGTGYGDPLDRDPAAVERDLVEG